MKNKKWMALMVMVFCLGLLSLSVSVSVSADSWSDNATFDNVTEDDGYVKLVKDDQDNLTIDGIIQTLGGTNYYNYVRIINGGILKVNNGQILRIYANEIYIDSSSMIDAIGSGYSGGAHGANASNAEDGVSYDGTGGGGHGITANEVDGRGGGGGGYGGLGGVGSLGWGGTGSGGTSGSSFGSESDTSIYLGSGGGAGSGSAWQACDNQSTGGGGGSGGGAVLLDSENIKIDGGIYADGEDGRFGTHCSGIDGHGGGGGGGSGGSILLKGKNVTITGTLTVTGGDGKGNSYGGRGGGGSGGRIKIFYEYLNTDSCIIDYSGGLSGGCYETKCAEGGENGTYYTESVFYTSSLPYKSSGAITSITKDAESVGVGYIWKQIKFEGDVPSETSVSIYVNSSNCGGFTLVEWNALSGIFYNLPACAQERFANWRLVLDTFSPHITPIIYNVSFIGDLDTSPTTTTTTTTSTTSTTTEPTTTTTTTTTSTTEPTTTTSTTTTEPTTTTTSTTSTTTTTTLPLCELGASCSSCTGWVTMDVSHTPCSGTYNGCVRDSNSNGKYDQICCSGVVSGITAL